MRRPGSVKANVVAGTVWDAHADPSATRSRWTASLNSWARASGWGPCCGCV